MLFLFFFDYFFLINWLMHDSNIRLGDKNTVFQIIEWNSILYCNKNFPCIFHKRVLNWIWRRDFCLNCACYLSELSKFCYALNQLLKLNTFYVTTRKLSELATVVIWIKLHKLQLLKLTTVVAMATLHLLHPGSYRNWLLELSELLSI